MCGIAGIVSHKLAAQSSILAGSKLIAALRHRGPDRSGCWADKHALLVHTRLAILDPARGAQPLSNEDGSVVVTFNGEIYNSPQLRRELQSRGHIFRTHTDTEVLVHLYEEYGLEMPRFLKGMFALGLWDASQQRLLLVRDRFGIKPLYYAMTTDELVFASQPYAMVASGKVANEMDVESIPIFLYYGYTPAWRCIYKKIHKLPPGHYLVIDVSSWTAQLRPYWTFPSPKTIPVNKRHISGETKDRIRHAVTRSLLSDVPIGLALSGGLDSSVIAYHCAREGGLYPTTFTIRWDNLVAQDSEWLLAQETKKRLRLQGYGYYISQDLLELAEEVYRTLDEPLGDSSILPLYYLCHRARENVKVLLTGDGGDELFAGYNRYLINRHELTIRRMCSPATVTLLRKCVQCVPVNRRPRILAKISRFLERMTLSPGMAYAVALAGTPLSMIMGWLIPEMVHILVSDLQRIASLWESAPCGDALDRMRYCDFQVLLPECLLMKADRASMAVGLEIRPSLLDNDLMEWALALPPRLQLGWRHTKKVIRFAYAPVLPSPVVWGKKDGFHTRKLSDVVCKCVPDLESKLREAIALHSLLDIQAIRKSIAQLRTGRQEVAQGLWNLYNLLLWYSAWKKYSL